MSLCLVLAACGGGGGGSATASVTLADVLGIWDGSYQMAGQAPQILEVVVIEPLQPNPDASVRVIRSLTLEEGGWLRLDGNQMTVEFWPVGSQQSGGRLVATVTPNATTGRTTMVGRIEPTNPVTGERLPDQPIQAERRHANPSVLGARYEYSSPDWLIRVDVTR